MVIIAHNRSYPTLELCKRWLAKIESPQTCRTLMTNRTLSVDKEVLPDFP